MSEPVFTASDVEALRERTLEIMDRYMEINGEPDDDRNFELSTISFLSMFQAYCELTGRQNPQ